MHVKRSVCAKPSVYDQSVCVCPPVPPDPVRCQGAHNGASTAHTDKGSKHTCIILCMVEEHNVMYMYCVFFVEPGCDWSNASGASQTQGERTRTHTHTQSHIDTVYTCVCVCVCAAGAMATGHQQGGAAGEVLPGGGRVHWRHHAQRNDGGLSPSLEDHIICKNNSSPWLFLTELVHVTPHWKVLRT